MSKQRLHTSSSQHEMILEFMRAHGDLLKPTKEADGKRKNFNLWAELTELLNKDLTGDPREAEKWKKVWSDAKSNTKQKAARLSRSLQATGGGKGVDEKLSMYERGVMEFVTPVAAFGMSGVEDAGVDLLIQGEKPAQLQFKTERRVSKFSEPEILNLSHMQVEECSIYDETGPSHNSPNVIDDEHLSSTPRLGRLGDPANVTHGKRRRVEELSSLRRPLEQRRGGSLDDHGEQLVKIELAKLELKKEQLEVRKRELSIQEQQNNINLNILSTLRELSVETRDMKRLLQLILEK